jgi:transcriptional regulator with XRE-family HTH domain
MKSDVDWLIENLPYIRAFAGWSQEQLAVGLDCSTSFINKLERGKLEMSVMCYLALERLIFAECEINPWLDDAVAILDGHVRYGIAREDLIEKIGETRKRLGMKSGSEKLMRELQKWIQNAEEETKC